jgi:hypothetical protein
MFTKLLSTTVLLVGAICVSLHGARASTYYNVVKQFSTKANPGGVWSYYGSELLPYRRTHYKGIKDLDGWSNGLEYKKNRVTILRNKTGHAVSFFHGDLVIPTDHVMMDGADIAGGGVVQFTAPVAGSYSLKGDFLSLAKDGAPHGVQVLLNQATQLWNHNLASGHDHKFKLTVTMAEGDTLQFFVFPSQANGPLQTGLAAKIVGP